MKLATLSLLALSLATSPAQDPLLSQDMQVVNQEMQRRGFSPDVYFDYDSSALTATARSQLSGNAELLKANPMFRVTIEGHCDERGTAEYNLALGERRAQAVSQYLTSLGVAASRLAVISYGKERPVCTVSAESCWSQNRHGHMVITGRSNTG